MENAALGTAGVLVQCQTGVPPNRTVVNVEAAGAKLGGHAFGHKTVVEPVTIRILCEYFAGLTHSAVPYGKRGGVAEFDVATLEVPAIAFGHYNRAGGDIQLQNGGDTLILRYD